MSQSKPAYLQITKNGFYRFRRVIPADIRAQYTKPVYIVAFRTRDPEEAKRLSHLEAVKFDMMVTRMRAAIAKRSASMVRTCDIDQISQRFEALLLHSDEAERARNLSDEELEEHKQLIREGAAQTADAEYARDPSDYLEDYLSFAETEGLRINPKWSHVDQFALSMLDAQARAYNALIERIERKLKPTPVIPPTIRSEEDVDDLQQLVANWIESQKVKEKTIIEVRSAMKRLKDFLNVSRVSQIQGHMPAKFRDWLLAHGCQQKSAGSEGGPLRVATVKKLIGLISATIQLAVDDKLLPANPFSGLRFKKKNDSIEIERFSVEQLNQLFSSPIYTRHLRPEGGAGEAAFWLPLMALFCGARETELGQPYLSNFGCEDGAYFFNVTDKEDGQTIKNEESRRQVPIHPTLIDIGLLDYIAWRKERGDRKLFPDLNADCKDALLGNWSKWFNRYLDNVVGIDERGRNFHSLRHTMKHYGRLSKMEPAKLDRIQGHTPANVGEIYGGDFPLIRLAEELNKFSVPGLDISHIKWTRPTGSEPKRLVQRVKKT